MINIVYLLLLLFIFELNLFTIGKSIIHNLKQDILLPIWRTRK